MGNMSYCRMKNTLRDLTECQSALSEGGELSAAEGEAAKKLLELCREMGDSYSDADVDAMVDAEDDEDDEE